MSKIHFNNFNKVENPTLVLQDKSGNTYGSIIDYNNLTYKNCFNSPNELSFTVYKSDHMSKEQKYIWDNIKNMRIIYIPEYDEKFEISIQDSISDKTTRAVTGTALAEAELSQIKLRNIEINTEIDIKNDKYDTNFRSVFYRDIDDVTNPKYLDIWSSDKKYFVYNNDGTINAGETLELRKEILRTSSVLHRLTEKAINYTIGHVDESLKTLDWIKTFSISDTYLYDELTGEIAKEYGVLFKFDSINRTINAYDLFNTCNECGYRGDFSGSCPKCGKSNYSGQYGMETPVLISADNLATEITKSGDISTVKTYFKIEGGDDLINAAVAAVNPTGNQYIFYFPDYMLNELPDGMKNRLAAYLTLQDEYENRINYLTEDGFCLSPANVKVYNDIVEYLKNHYEKEIFLKLGEKSSEYDTFEYNDMIGYSATSILYYSLIDIENILKVSLSPTPKDPENPTFEETFELINSLHSSVIAVSDLKNVLTASVTNAVESMIKATINTSVYKPELLNATYDNESHIWSGVVKLTNLLTTEDEKAEFQEQNYTFNITDDITEYTKQKIQKNKDRYDVEQICDLTSLEEETYNGQSITKDGVDYSNWYQWFEKQLEYYSVENLELIQQKFLSCKNILADLKDKLDKADTISIQDDDGNDIMMNPYEHYNSLYNKRIEYINIALSERSQQLSSLYSLYKYDDETNTSTGELVDIRKKVNQILNFEEYLKGNGRNENYWNMFCAYLREDTYSNSNYISTGLDNKYLIERAKELIDTAKREIQKSANIQYTIQSTMNNLFAIPDFEPIKEYFDVGNWIHVDVDDKIERLRLLSYQINFDSIQNIDVEFSTVVFSPICISDLQSIFNSVSTISGSYDSVVRQVDQTVDTINKINHKLDNGIDASLTKIKNDSLIEDVIIDKDGILGRAYDDITKTYDSCQYRFVRNGLYLTNDNWKTIYSSIGKFNYIDGEESKTAYGVKADTIVGNLIFGNKLIIKNNDGSLKFDNSGLNVLGKNGNSVIINPNDDKVFRLNNGKDDVIYMGKDGQAYFSGVLTAEKGQIASYKIDGDTLSSENTIFDGETDNQQYVLYYDDNGNQYETGDSEGKTVNLRKHQQNTSLIIPGEFKIDGWNKDYYYEDFGNYHLGYNNWETYNTTMNTQLDFTHNYYEGDVSNKEAIMELPNENTSVQHYAYEKSHLNSNELVFENNFESINGSSELSAGSLKFYNSSDETINIAGGSGIELKGDLSLKINNKPVSLEGHTHSYLPLSGGTMTGAIKIANLTTTSHTKNNTGLSFMIMNGTSSEADSPTETNDVYLAGAADSNGVYLRSYPVYSRIYDGKSANVFVTNHGTLGRIPSSSIRYKHDVNYFTNIDKKVIDDNKLSKAKEIPEDDLLSILDIPVVSFKYNDGYINVKSNDDDKPEVGFIADDVASICPECATYINDENGNPIPESWNERQLIPRMLYVIQQQQKAIEKLEKQLEVISNELH